MACSMLIQCSNTLDHGMFNAHSVFQHHWSWHVQCSFSVPTPLIMACSMLIQCSNTLDHGMFNAHSVLQHHWSWHAQCSFSVPTPLIMACSMLIQCSNTLDHGMFNAHSVLQHHILLTTHKFVLISQYRGRRRTFDGGLGRFGWWWGET